MNREIFIKAVERKNDSGMTVFGTGTNIVCRDIMEKVNVYSPENAPVQPESYRFHRKRKREQALYFCALNSFRLNIVSETIFANCPVIWL